MKRTDPIGEEEKTYLSRLSVGEGIVKMQDRWHQPFLVRYPHMPVKKGAVSDLHLQEYVEEGRGVIGIGSGPGGFGGTATCSDGKPRKRSRC